MMKFLMRQLLLTSMKHLIKSYTFMPFTTLYSKTIKHIGTIVSRLLCHSENKSNRKAMKMTKTLNIFDIEKNIWLSKVINFED